MKRHILVSRFRSYIHDIAHIQGGGGTKFGPPLPFI